MEDQLLPKPAVKYSLFKLFLLNGFACAINFGWSVFFLLSGPLFATLGVSNFWVAFATASGPVAGLIQPFVGVASDNCTSRFGRRKPFIFAGLICGLVGMALFANSQKIGDLNPDPKAANLIAIIIAVISLWFFNIGLNMIQATGMALLLDSCGDQIDLATSVNSMSMGFATVLANFLGIINFVSFLPFLNGNYEAVYYLGIIIVVVTSIPTLIVGHDPPLAPTENTSSLAAFREIVVGMGRKAIGMKLSTFLVLFLYFLLSSAQYPWMLYFTDYMGRDIYHGNPDAPLGTLARAAYDKGVRMGSFAQGVYGVLTMLICIPMVQLIEIIGHKGLMLIAILWGGVSIGFVVWPITFNYITAFALCAASGVFNGVVNAVPWALLSLTIEEDEIGLYVGILNSSQVAAQLISSVIAGVIMSHTTGLGLGVDAPGIASGAIYLVLAVPLMYVLIIPEKTEKITAVENPDPVFIQ